MRENIFGFQIYWRYYECLKEPFIITFLLNGKISNKVVTIYGYIKNCHKSEVTFLHKRLGTWKVAETRPASNDDLIS